MNRSTRRRFLRALGVSGATSFFLPSIFRGRARAGVPAPPTRVVFFITPHGTVWNHWKPTELVSDTVIESELTELSPILAPLAPHASKLTIVDGLSRPTYYADLITARRIGGDTNGHSLGRAHALCASPALNGGGSLARGGGESIDQYIGRSIRGPAPWSSRVWGFNRNEPYSYLAAGEAATRVADPAAAFREIMGFATPPSMGEPTRDELLRAGRANAATFASEELASVAVGLSGADRQKLERHRDLLADLARQLGGRLAPGVSCNPVFAPSGDTDTDFARLIALVLACDLTRVVTYTPNIPVTQDLGGRTGADLHAEYAHHSIEGEPSWTMEGETVMTELNRRYAERFATLLGELDSIPEGDGTLLDHSIVVWTSECATGSHQHWDLPIVLGGGGNGTLRTGRFVSYPRAHAIPFTFQPQPERIGPAHTRLYVTLMRAVGMPDNTFGDFDEIQGVDGGDIPLGGVLEELLV